MSARPDERIDFAQELLERGHQAVGGGNPARESAAAAHGVRAVGRPGRKRCARHQGAAGILRC